MPLWTIVRIDPATRQETLLGRVRAKHSPAALLGAIGKFNVVDIAAQRQLLARPVARQKAPEPPSPEEAERMRAVSKAFSRLMRGRWRFSVLALPVAHRTGSNAPSRASGARC